MKCRQLDKDDFNVSAISLDSMGNMKMIGNDMESIKTASTP